MKTKERIFYYDFLRAFAIIAVILCHVGIFYGSQVTQTQTISRLIIADIGRCGVPIFLMISGALLLNRTESLSDFLKKRFSRIIYPYIFWVALIALGIFFIQKDYNLMIKVIIGDFSVTWYFWTLIGVYLAIPVINSFLKEYGEDALKYFLAIWILTIVLKTVNHYPLFTHFNLDFFAGYLGYPILGYYLDNKEFNLSDSKILMISLGIFALFFAISGYIDCLHLPINIMYQSIILVILSSALFLVIKSINGITSFKAIKDNIIGKIIFLISIYSYGMYFSHVLVLKALAFVNPHSDLLFPVMVIALIFLS